MAEKGHLHDGHRERMRERFLTSNARDFKEHELLEMLLFHTHARGNTNDTAHALIEAFGSLDNVFESDVDRLLSVSGIGEKSAFLLSLVGELAKRYTLTKLAPETNVKGSLDTAKKVAAFLAPRFLGTKNEQAYALLVDNGMRPVDCFPVGDGTVTSIPLSVRNIAERAYSKRAAAVFLAHNHPDGMAIPSTSDVNATLRIKEALSLLEIPLLEHFIFAGNNYAMILRNENPADYAPVVAASPLFETTKKQFYKKQEGEEK